MIAANLSDIGTQVPQSPSLQQALAFLRRPDIAALPDGRVDIDGDTVFALVQRYETVSVPDPKFECHHRYIDVQYIAAGAEIVGWMQLDNMFVDEPYRADKDICFGKAMQGRWTPVYLPAGHAAIFYPSDAHAPKLAAGGPAAVIKIVVKVAV